MGAGVMRRPGGQLKASGADALAGSTADEGAPQPAAALQHSGTPVGAVEAASCEGAPLDVDVAVLGEQLLSVVVQTMGGQDALPRSDVGADLTVGQLLAVIPGPPGTQSLTLGGRVLGGQERLCDLEVPNPEEGLVLILVRQALSTEVLERLEAAALSRELFFNYRQDISDAEVAGIARLVRDPACRISKISLSRSNVVDITSIGEALQFNSSVQDLGLAHTKVRDISTLAEAVRLNCGLRALHLQFTEVSDIRALAEALHSNTTLEVLDLERAKVREVGGFAAVVMTNRTLKRIDLTGCPIPPAAKQLLRAAREARLAGSEDKKNEWAPPPGSVEVSSLEMDICTGKTYFKPNHSPDMPLQKHELETAVQELNKSMQGGMFKRCQCLTLLLAIIIVPVALIVWLATKVVAVLWMLLVLVIVMLSTFCFVRFHKWNCYQVAQEHLGDINSRFKGRAEFQLHTHDFNDGESTNTIYTLVVMNLAAPLPQPVAPPAQAMPNTVGNAQGSPLMP